jgi:hypothetical protein
MSTTLRLKFTEIAALLRLFKLSSGLYYKTITIVIMTRLAKARIVNYDRL